MKKRFVTALLFAAVCVLLCAVPASADSSCDVEIGQHGDYSGICSGEYLLTDSDGTIHNGNSSHYNIHYDAEKSLLVLKDAVISTDQQRGIYLNKSMNIQFSGLNRITMEDRVRGDIMGIYCDGDLTISGSDSLAISLGKTYATSNVDPVKCAGISAEGDIIFKDGSGSGASRNSGYYTITGNEIVFANDKCRTMSVYSHGGSIIVNGGSYNLSGGKTRCSIGLCAEKNSGKGGSIFIRKSDNMIFSVNQETKKATGLKAEDHIQIDGGKISLEGKGADAVYAEYNVNVTDGILKVHADQYGLHSNKTSVVITGGSHRIEGAAGALFNMTVYDQVLIGINMFSMAGASDSTLKTGSYYNGEKVCWLSEFTDLKANWYRLPVLWASVQEITTGTDATHFSPDLVCTRAQIVTLLYRTLEVKENSGKNPFTDVKKGSYYYDAVCWANDKGITKGTDASHFSPDKPCTRAEVAALLYRYMGVKTNVSIPFKDVPKNSYYYDAVTWMVNKKITTGTDAAHFSPNKSCTRGEIITFIYRALQNK